MTRTEMVQFKVLVMPCCSHQLCWVNPRLPTYCPECGSNVFTKLKFDPAHTLLSDNVAYLKFHTGSPDIPDVVDPGLEI